MASNCTELVHQLEMYYLPTMYTLEFCLGFLGNLVVILGYIFCLKEWKSFNVYLFNLSVSDLIFLCTLPRLVHNYIHGNWKENSSYFCISNRYILHVNLYSSILFMVWVSVDRYLLLKNPLRLHVLQRLRSAIVVAILTWVIVNVQIAPLMYFIIEDLKSNHWSTCNDFASLSGTQGTLSYSLALTLTGYLLPLLGLCLSSYKLTVFLKAQERMFDSQAASYRRPLRLVVALAAMFFLLYSPYHVMRNVRIASLLPQFGFPRCTKDYIEGIYIITRPIAFSHSVLNPIFYFFMGDHFRELLLDKLKKLMVGKSSHHQGN
ncbi:hypothetical protein MATL_G00119610 [Megalops atlanticus]|uniref:G-protein coupled receptors family 1 profile domain-containing protein n=1 Tax=Megalops atlanticus TaxID=7932 RepID=A0A9D3PZI5_MEGAT|nr:hypothetical protein MATL_G00119610 [Megalops atlanticus]